jgi:hypothetical protein
VVQIPPQPRLLRMSRVSGKPYFLYVLWSCSGRCFYIGISEDPLTREEQHNLGTFKGWSKEMPEEWYQSDSEGLRRLIYTLFERRSIVRDLITAFRNSNRNPFPNWADNWPAPKLPAVRKSAASQRSCCPVVASPNFSRGAHAAPWTPGESTRPPRTTSRSIVQQELHN